MSMIESRTVDPRSFDALVWHPVDPKTDDGPQMAVLWGDPTRGQFGALLRVPPGFESPMHVHTLDERVVQLQGRSVHWTIDQSGVDAPVMEPGDYMLMPGGVAHVSANTDAAESLELIAMDGPFDFTIYIQQQR
jgi:anti-sigma factor ChrR (cupin superfamily)